MSRKTKTKSAPQKARPPRRQSKPTPKVGGPPHGEPAADLPGLGPINPVKFTLGPVATAIELFPITGRTDAQLRAIQIQLNPAARAPWFEKPARGKYNTLKTLAGLRAYDDHRLSAEKVAALPQTFASMQDCEARLRFPVEMQQFARTKGCPAFEASNRVRRDPLLEFFHPIFQKIFAGAGVQLKGIEGMEQLDADLELAKLREAQRQKIEDETLIRRGQMLMLPAVEELLWEKGLAPLRADILNFRKITGGQLKTMLLSLGLKPADADRAVDLAALAVENILKHLRDLIPPRIAATAEQKKAA